METSSSHTRTLLSLANANFAQPPLGLWIDKVHIQNHKSNHKRKKALLAFQEVSRSPGFYCSTPTSSSITTLFENFQARLRAAIPPSSAPMADSSKDLNASSITHAPALSPSSPETVETRSTPAGSPLMTSPRDVPSMSPTTHNISLSFSLPENITLPVCVPHDAPDQDHNRVDPSLTSEDVNPSSCTYPSAPDDQAPQDVVAYLMEQVSSLVDLALVNEVDKHTDTPLPPKVNPEQVLLLAIPSIEEQLQVKDTRVAHVVFGPTSLAHEPSTEAPQLSFDPKPKREEPANITSPSILEILDDPQSKDDILDSQEPPSAPKTSPASSPEIEELSKKISPTGPPTARAFSKPTNAQKARMILERCNFCEKRFYSKLACEKHIKDLHISTPPSQPSLPPIARSSESSSQILSSSEDFRTPPNVREITIRDQPKVKKQKTSLFPVVPPYHFFCHICVDYFDTDITKAQHFKAMHNLLLKNISHKPKTSTVAIPKSSPPVKRETETSVLKKKISVPHVEDHTDVNLSVLDQALLTGPRAGPVSVATPKISRPSLKRKVTIPKLPTKRQSPSSVSVTTAVVHQEQQHPRVAPTSDNWLCRLCAFEAKNKNGLRLHYFRSHGQRIPPDDRFSPKSGLKRPDPALKTSNSKNTAKSKNPSIKFSSDAIEALPSAGEESSTQSNSPQDSRRKKPSLTTTATRSKPPLPPQESRIFTNKQFTKLPEPIPNTSISKPTSSNEDPSMTQDISMPDPWFTTNTSIKKHLNTFLKAPPTSVEFWCFICKRRIAKNPASHPCLKNKLVLPRPTIANEDEWSCHLCKSFSTSSTLGKHNHLASHNRDNIKQAATALTIPTSTKQRKRMLKRRVQTLAEGDPGSLPLARPVATNTSTNPDLQPIEE
ncbi:hypothetical protein NPIL_623271 [Nephila pilipes]|uniref:C2H2-type domain-containing protein n=1 Tax=Nephila pilipes TaxID=299642 RepID=A0A8X6UVU2_NEPPI|nr:hypothetical protein NPIL_623271 [Nephila pilipes]